MQKALPATDQPIADMRWLWGFVQRQRVSTIGAIASGIIGGITAAAEPYLIGLIIDHLQAGVSMDVILQDIFWIIVFAIITVIAFYGQRYYSGQIAYTTNYEIRSEVFDNLLVLDQGFYNHFPVGDLISRLHVDLEMLWRLLALGFMRGWAAATGLIITFILLGTVNLQLSIMVFIVLAISTFFQIRAGLVLAPVFEKVQDQAGAYTALVQDAFTGIQTIKTFGAEAGVSEAFKKENHEYRRRWLYFKRRNEPVGMLPNAISQLTTGIVVLFGGILVVQNQLTLGNFAQFMIYLLMISNVLLQLGTIYQRYQQAKGALARITPMLRHTSIQDSAQPLSVIDVTEEKLEAEQPHKAFSHHRAIPCEIEYKNVSLHLDGTPLLHDISLTIPAGSVYAFVGPTGCGKTALVNLIARVNDVNEGSVNINGIDVREIELAELREIVTYVPQSTFLFSRTLSENVLMGKEEIDKDYFDRAVRISRISNDLTQLPDGLETLVGEKGVMLSGGQKQRVAIARAIVRDPSILVLDDALSSVDVHTAADILSGLRSVLKTRTSLIIAHRIGTVKDADCIVVMNHGRIVEKGKHEELLAKQGFYARMVERELKEEADRVED